MSAVVSAIGNAIGGVVEAVGDVVEGVGDVLSDVGEAIDDYVIQPILDDPLTAVATVAGAAFLGPAIAPALSGFGAAAGAVGAGLGAAAANTTAGLVQGEDFDEALKGGLIAGVTAGATKGAFDYFGGGDSAFSGRTETGLATLPDEAISLPSNDLTLLSDAVPDNIPGGATTAAVPPPPPLNPTPLDFVDDAAANTVDDIATASTSAPPPSPLAQVSTPDYLNTSAQSNVGLRVPKFDPMASLPRDLSGNIDYSLTAGMQSTGPGLQFPSTTGGPGLSIAQEAIPDFTYSMNSLDPSIRGMGDVWTGESGKLYGMGSPAGTINQYGFTPAPETIQYASTPSVAPKSLADKLKSFELGDINKQDVTGLAGKVVDYAIENPLTTLAGITLATGALSQGAPPSAQPQPGSTRDPSFTRPMDIYNYVRQQNQYGDDFSKYGQTGGEFQFFTPARFDLVNPPANARNGGLMKFANGGQMPMRRPPMGGLAQAMQTGNMPPAGGGMRGQMMPQGNMPQGRPQPVNRNPKTSYYQYGAPPTKMANGGALNMVRSYNVGGGADGRSDDVNAVLSDGEYVFDAETVALLGNGSSEAGADRLDQMREEIRKQKGQSLAKGKISPDAKSPLSYLKRS
jgi:hypothetical protein